MDDSAFLNIGRDYQSAGTIGGSARRGIGVGKHAGHIDTVHSPGRGCTAQNLRMRRYFVHNVIGIRLKLYSYSTVSRICWKGVNEPNAQIVAGKNDRWT
jgi:hypothetical protein